MRSWACTLVPIALTSVFATSPYSPSGDPPWETSPQRVRRRSKAGGMFAVRSLGRSSRAGFGSVALLSRNSVASAHRQPSAEVRRRLSLAARKPRDHRPPRGCFSPSRDFLPAPQDAWFGCKRSAGSVMTSSSSSSSSSRSSSSSSSRSSTSSTSRSTSSSSNNCEDAPETRWLDATNADDPRAAQDATVDPRGRSKTLGNALASWPAGLSPNTGINYAETVKEAARWLEVHDVVDPAPSAAELLAKAAGYRSPQDMSSKLASLAASEASAASPQPALEMTPAEWHEMRRLCGLRAAQHVPVQYLVGEWDFYGLSLEMHPPTLIPRPETEELVDRILQWIRQEGIATANTGAAVVGGGVGGDGGAGHGGGAAPAGLQFLDVGSGTGVIGLTLLNELPKARCVAIDAQPAAVRLSRRNAERTGLQPRYSCFHEKIADFGTGLGAGAGNGKPTSAEKGGSLEISRAEGGGVGDGEGGGGAFDGSFDFIVSNPPYIPRSDMEALPPDVADHEDSVALDGGEDGLDVVRDIVRRCPRLLRRGGPRELWMEVDTSHPEAMQRWLGLAVGGGAVQECAAHGVTRFEWMSDMSQRPRFVRLTFAEHGDDAEEKE